MGPDEAARTLRITERNRTSPIYARAKYLGKAPMLLLAF
jgi:hypothetical protein